MRTDSQRACFVLGVFVHISNLLSRAVVTITRLVAEKQGVCSDKLELIRWVRVDFVPQSSLFIWLIVSENGVPFAMFCVISVLCWATGKVAMVKLRSVSSLRGDKDDVNCCPPDLAVLCSTCTTKLYCAPSCRANVPPSVTGAAGCDSALEQI